MLDGVGRPADAHALAAQTDLAGRERVDAEDRARELRAPAAHQPGDADDLAGVHIEVDAAHAGRRAQVAHGQQRRPGPVDRAAGVLHRATDRAPDDELDQPLHIELGRRPRAHDAPVAQHGHAVGHGDDLLEAVRDVDDRDAALLEALDDLKQRVDLAVGERGGRLVHDQDARVLRERLGDLDELEARGAQAADLRARVDVDPELREQLARPALERAVVEQPGPRPRLAREVDVLRDRERRDEAELLEDHRHAVAPRGLRRAELDGLAVELDRPAVERVDALEDLHERRLPGAVAAEQGVHLARPQLEVDVVEDRDARERLADAGHAQERRRHRAAAACSD